MASGGGSNSSAASSSGGSNGRYPNIGLQGHPLGNAQFKEDRIEWKDLGRGTNVKEFLKSDLASLAWTIFGSKGYLKITMKEGKSAKMDGFQKSDYDTIADYCLRHYEMELAKEKVRALGHP